MNSLKTFILVPMLVAFGFAAVANGEEAVKVRASIQFLFNGVTFGYQEPCRERVVVVEQPVIRVVERRPVYVVERTRPVVYIVQDNHHYMPGPGRGLKLGHSKQEVRRVVVKRGGRNNDDNHRRGEYVNEVVRVEKGNSANHR